MKKISAIVIFVVLVICSGLYVNAGFKKIEEERPPYYVNREQFVAAFVENKETFETLVEILRDYDRNIRYNSNSNNGSLELEPDLVDERLNDVMNTLIHGVGITNIQKYGNKMLVDQYAPIVGSDIRIGVEYDFEKNQWRFNYSHFYGSCGANKHNRMIYKLYDKIYNKEGILVLD